MVFCSKFFILVRVFFFVFHHRLFPLYNVCVPTAAKGGRTVLRGMYQECFIMCESSCVCIPGTFTNTYPSTIPNKSPKMLKSLHAINIACTFICIFKANLFLLFLFTIDQDKTFLNSFFCDDACFLL